MKKVVKSLERYFTRLGQERVRQQLLRLDDRLLEDAGFSRELLEGGIKTWPWRAMQEDGAPRLPDQLQMISEAEVQQAVAELRALDDRELNDLGLGRDDIEYAVRYGRPQDRRAA